MGTVGSGETRKHPSQKESCPRHLQLSQEADNFSNPASRNLGKNFPEIRSSSSGDTRAGPPRAQALPHRNPATGDGPFPAPPTSPIEGFLATGRHALLEYFQRRGAHYLCAVVLAIRQGPRMLAPGPRVPASFPSHREHACTSGKATALKAQTSL